MTATLTRLAPTFACGHPREGSNIHTSKTRAPRCLICFHRGSLRKRNNMCVNGHPWTTDSTEYRISHGKKVRRCVTCRREQERRSAAQTTTLPGTTPRPVVADRGVIENAKCAGADVRDFFPKEGEQGIPARARQAARTYCAECPMRQRCGDQATAARDQGLWGGAWRSVEPDQKTRYRITLLVEEQNTYRKAA